MSDRMTPEQRTEHSRLQVNITTATDRTVADPCFHGHRWAAAATIAGRVIKVCTGCGAGG